MSNEFNSDMKKLFGFLKGRFKNKDKNKNGWFSKIFKHMKRD